LDNLLKAIINQTAADETLVDKYYNCNEEIEIEERKVMRKSDIKLIS